MLEDNDLEVKVRKVLVPMYLKIIANDEIYSRYTFSLEEVSVDIEIINDLSALGFIRVDGLSSHYYIYLTDKGWLKVCEYKHLKNFV